MRKDPSLSDFLLTRGSLNWGLTRSTRKEVMVSKRQVTARRRRRSGGNVFLESVFTILPTFALIGAFADFGLMVFRWSTLQNAVREGARYAVTYQTQSGMGQDASIKAVVAQYALGMVSASDSHIKVNYYAPTDLNTPIGSGGNTPGNIVEVSVQNISWTWLAPMSGSFGGTLPAFRDMNPINLSVYSSDMMGGYPVGTNSVAR